MALRDDLEDELHATWNQQTLAVYADHLQSLGDPRGELIALDLAGDPAPRRGIDARRGEVSRGPLAALRAHLRARGADLTGWYQIARIPR